MQVVMLRWSVHLSVQLFFLSIAFSLVTHADPLMIELSPSPSAGLNDSSLVTSYTHPPDDRNHLLPSDYASGGDSGGEDPFDFKKYRPPFWFALESGHVLLMGLPVLEALLSAVINNLLNGDYDNIGEPEDGGTGEASNPQSTQSSGQSSKGIIRLLVSSLCGCFGGSSSSGGGAAGGDGDDPRRNRKLSNVPKAETCCLLDSDTEDDEDSEAAIAIACGPSVPLVERELLQTCGVPPVESESLQLQADVHVPATTTDTVKTTHQGYMHIAHNIYLSQTGETAENLIPADNKKIVYIYLEKSDRHIPVLLTNVPDDFQCAVCQDLMINPVRLDCDKEHSFCEKCVSSIKNNKCPNCQASFSKPVVNKEHRRRLANLVITCPWCQQRTTFSEAASHLTHCERQPVCCAHCQAYIDPGQLAAHLKICTGQEINVAGLDAEQLRLLVVQLAGTLQEAVIPERSLQGPQLIQLSGDVLLQPVASVPELYTKVGGAGTQFYIRADLSDGLAVNDKITHRVAECTYKMEDVVYNMSVHITSDSVRLAFHYTSDAQLMGDWKIETLDHQGLKIEQHSTTVRSSEQNHMQSFTIVLSVRLDSIRNLVIAPPPEFWNQDPKNRIYFFHLTFVPR